METLVHDEPVKGRLAPGTLLGRYEIVGLLGVGGMGEVYLAEDSQLGRKVAIKLLNEKYENNESNVQRFIQEAKAASALNHPNILTIYEIGRTEHAHYIVSEFIDGRTLRHKMESGPLELSSILDISLQIAGALAAAHAAGIVHRDIKPDNIVIRHDGYVKILDFGLAKLVAKPVTGFEDATLPHNQTAEGMILGTASYMSPEQARGVKIDERTDIFSLGAVIYEMAAGRTPFHGESLSDTFANLINKEPQPLSRFAMGVPNELQRIVSKMLRKDPDERFQTMKELMADLRELKDRITAESKFDRQFRAETERDTAMLARTTGEAAKDTVETINAQRPWYRRGAVLALVPVVLIIAAAFVWYMLRKQPAAPQAQIKSLAVLPLKSLDASENYLGLGIADAVIRRISQTGEVIVRPTSAVRHYLNEDTDAVTIAHQLNTDAALEGSFQRAGDRLRVSVNLLRTADGLSLWADSYDMNASDIFKIQDTVAQQVAANLKLELDPAQKAGMEKRYTSNPVAYEYYVKAIYSLDQRGYGKEALPQMQSTIDLFKQAIEADPNYALAHAQLAFAYVWNYLFIDSENAAWAQLATDEIKRAEELDPQLAETHNAKGALLWSRYQGFQTEAAMREFLMAQELNPSVGHLSAGALFAHMGLEDAASREIQLAADVDPTSEAVKELVVSQYYIEGRYDDYLAAFQKAYPGGSVGPWYLLGKGRLDEAQQALKQTVKLNWDAREIPLHEGVLYALRGDLRSAEAEIPAILSSFPPNDQARHHALYAAACIYALAGKSNEAVRLLRETAAWGYPNYPLFQRDHYLDRIRQTPEFVQFMAEMKAQNDKFRSEFQ